MTITTEATTKAASETTLPLMVSPLIMAPPITSQLILTVVKPLVVRELLGVIQHLIGEQA